MADGLVLPPQAGRVIAGGPLRATLKVAGGPSALASTFEIDLQPGYDVGAHVHTQGEELFYVVEGTLDLLAFEPLERSAEDWHEWVAPDGRRYLRGGPGSLMHVPAGIPHAFANSSSEPARILFQAAPSGHEDYFEELAVLLRDSGGDPAPDAVAALRARHDIHQLTALRGRRGAR